MGHIRYVFTYGAPRVGNRAFVAKLQTRVGVHHGESEGWRVIYNADFVPDTVPSFMGYVHAFAESHLVEPTGSFQICQPPDMNAAILTEDLGCSTVYRWTVLWTPDRLERAVMTDHTSYGNDRYFMLNTLDCGGISEMTTFYNSTVDFSI